MGPTFYILNENYYSLLIGSSREVQKPEVQKPVTPMQDFGMTAQLILQMSCLVAFRLGKTKTISNRLLKRL